MNLRHFLKILPMFNKLYQYQTFMLRSYVVFANIELLMIDRKSC